MNICDWSRWLFWIFKYLIFIFYYWKCPKVCFRWQKWFLRVEITFPLQLQICFILPYNQIIKRNNQIIRIAIVSMRPRLADAGSKQSAPMLHLVTDGFFDIVNLVWDIHPYICTVFPFMTALFLVKYWLINKHLFDNYPNHSMLHNPATQTQKQSATLQCVNCDENLDLNRVFGHSKWLSSD